MKKQFTAELKEGDIVESTFLVREKNLLNFRKKNGQYLHLLLADRSGEIEAKLWDHADDLEKVFHRGSLVMVKGTVVAYLDSLQIKIDDLHLANDNEIDLTSFVALSDRPVPNMQEELALIVSDMQPGPLNELVNVFMGSTYYEKFCTAPAAKKFHQNSRGGLMEHTLGVMQICLRIANIHQEIDRDLILTGALFHDIGKIQEMDFFPDIEYTDEGKLLGHIILGVLILDNLIQKTPGVDAALRNQLLHMITSHHGEYKWQSPKRPMFLEAKVLHLADMMDAEIWKFKQAVPSFEGSNWSDFMKTIGNEVFIANRTAVSGEEQE